MAVVLECAFAKRSPKQNSKEVIIATAATAGLTVSVGVECTGQLPLRGQHSSTAAGSARYVLSSQWLQIDRSG